MSKNTSFKYLYELAEGDMGFVKEILDLMLKNIPADIKAIEKALVANDLKQAKKDAHRMKSSIQYGGSIELSDLLEAIENKKDITKVKEAMPSLKELADKLLETIKAEKKR